MITPQAPLPRGLYLDVAAFVAFLTDQITKTQEAHGVLLNKYYEIPFEKEYAMGFPLSYLVTNATRLHSVTRDDLA